MYRLDDRLAIVQTVDFFAPIVDDPYTYGAIAAANALSDIYAMGAEPLLALNVAAFPETLPVEIVAEIFRGGSDKVREAGAVVAGGHSVYDAEPKYGLAVTGRVDPARILTKAGARPGDALYLTKPIGTGVLCSWLKGGAIDETEMQEAVASMLRLNRDGAHAALAAGAHALTDITGFGLLGHADEMARASGARIVIDASAVPLFPRAIEAVRAGVRTGGSNRNEEYLAPRVRVAAGVARELVELLYDPQTSGPLLVALPPERAGDFEAACRQRGQPCWGIGEVAAGEGIEVVA